jgi:hypothetical protein
MKQDARLRDQAKTTGGKESAEFVQVVDLKNGAVRAQFALDTGKGSFSVREAMPAGKWVVVADNHNRVLVYSLEGKLVMRLFGTRPTSFGPVGVLALEAEKGVLEIYDLSTSMKRQELNFGRPLAYYTFVQDATKMFALTNDQTGYLVDLPSTALK